MGKQRTIDGLSFGVPSFSESVKERENGRGGLKGRKKRVFGSFGKTPKDGNKEYT